MAERGNLWCEFIMNVGRATPRPAGNFLLQLSYQYPITNGKAAPSFLSKIQPLYQMLPLALATSELSAGYVTGRKRQIFFPHVPFKDPFRAPGRCFPTA